MVKLKKKYEVISLEKFGKINKKQKRNIILKSLTALVYAEASVLFLATAVASHSLDVVPFISPLFYIASFGAAFNGLISAREAKRDERNNNKLVNREVLSLSRKLHDTQNELLAKK